MIRLRQRRRAGRVVVRSPDGRVLLFRGGDPARPEAGTWWVTPGGGMDPGETTADAARRELLEETGLAVGDLGPVRMHRTTKFEFNGVAYKQKEDYFLIEGPAFDVDTSRWSPLERASFVESRWWPIDELRTTDEEYYPEELVALSTGRTLPRSDLPRVTLVLLGIWSLAVLLNALSSFLERTMEARAFSNPNFVEWHNPFPFGLWPVLFLLWLLSLNLAIAGLLLGVIDIARRGRRRVLRAVGFAAVVIGGGIAEFGVTSWVGEAEDPPGLPGHMSFVHDGRLGAVLTALLAIAVMGLSALLLTSSGSARRRGRSCPSPSPRGDTAP